MVKKNFFNVMRSAVVSLNVVVGTICLSIYLCIYIYINIAEMKKKERPILCYSEFRAKALVGQTITESHSELHLF